MGKALVVEVKESVSELKQLYKQLSPSKQKRIQLLLLMKKGTHHSKDSLALALGVSGQSVHTWRTNYLKGGLPLLLEDNRGGFKQATISPTIKEQLDKRLSSPSDGFTSYKGVQQWLKDSFSIEMKYSTLYQFLKRNFGVKLKVGRKTHIHKSPAEEAVFKNAALFRLIINTNKMVYIIYLVGFIVFLITSIISKTLLRNEARFYTLVIVSVIWPVSLVLLVFNWNKIIKEDF